MAEGLEEIAEWSLKDVAIGGGITYLIYTGVKVSIIYYGARLFGYDPKNLPKYLLKNLRKK